MFSSHTMQLLSLQPDNVLNYLEPYRQAHRWLVAYSGGVDSHVLLHLLSQLYQLPAAADKPLPVLSAIHINHQLQPQAAQWAQHCKQQAALLGVPLTTHNVDVVCQPRESLEAKARQARYQCFERLLKPGDLLLMAHHLDDQVETLLLRLLRGSGSRGMAAMAHSRTLGRAQVLRPLLDIPRSGIEQYARQHSLHWVEDPSNQCCDFDRNFLRLRLLPLLATRWPNYRQTLARAAALNEESSIVNNELADLDLHSLGLSACSASLPLSALAQLSTARTKNLLRYWLQARGLTLPTAAQLQTVLEQVVDAKPDADPLVQWPMRTDDNNRDRRAVQIRRFRGELYAMAALPEFDTSAVYQWNPAQTLLINGVCEMTTRLVIGKGMKRYDALTVKFRQGGERCKPSGRAGSQTLKKLFQEYAVPTWQRDRVPLIYVGDTLAAVGDLWVCDGFTAVDDEPGLVFVWRQAQ